MNTNETLGEFILFQTENGDTHVQVRIEGETVWMTQKAMAELFKVSISTISRHLKNIFKEKELNEKESLIVRSSSMRPSRPIQF